VIGRLRGVMSGGEVERSHVDDISFILGRKLGMAVSEEVRRIVGESSLEKDWPMDQ